MPKPYLIFALLLFISIQMSHAQEEAPTVYEGWVLVWSDEFNSTEINQNIWTFDIGNRNGWGNEELQYYTNDTKNAFIEDGKLVIQANKEEKEGFDYTSARMITQNKYNVTYGRIEASIMLPSGKGLWPGFWLVGENIDAVGWPLCGEIDIMEWVGNDPENIHGSTHGPGFDTSAQFKVETGSTEFHKYTVNWQPDSVEFSMDDQVYETVTPDNTEGEDPFHFNDNLSFILLNLAVGGKWPGNPDESVEFPQRLTVDWVRVYQKNEDGKSVALSPSTLPKPTRRKCRRKF